jgi:putative hemolysin
VTRNSIALLSAFAVFVFFAGLFAGSETGLYQMSRLRLRIGIERKRFSYIILGRCLHDSAGFLLSMLLGTNLAHYLATSVITYMFLSRAGAEHTAEFFATLVNAPVLFVFSEMIPKSIFLYRADFLMPRVAGVLYGFHSAFRLSGIVPLLKLISGLFGRAIGLNYSTRKVITSAQRHHVTAILQETHEEGILSPVQADILKRIVEIPNVRLRSVMVPIANVRMVDVNCDRSALIDRLKESAHTRRPVCEGDCSRIIGVIDIYEALCSPTSFADVRAFVRPIRSLSADTTVIDAIDVVQKEKLKMVLVTKSTPGGPEKPVGIVTMKDLAEELLGELAEW